MKACKHDDIPEACEDCKQEQMRDIVEKAGEKWHRRISTGEARFVCSCGIGAVHNDHADEHANPSPTDLNELFRLAEKLGYKHTDIKGSTDYHTVRIRRSHLLCWSKVSSGNTRADALREALWQAIQEVK